MTDQGTQQVPISEAMRMAIDHHQAGRLQQAELIYKAVLESEPEHAGARYNLGLIALQTGHAERAIPVFKAACGSDPDNAGHWMNLAAALVGGGDAAGARDVLKQARQRGLGGGALAEMLSQVERMAGSALAAVVETEEAEGSAPLRAANVSAITQLFRQGRYAEVEEAASPLLSQFPESAPLWHLLGAALLEQGKYDKARETLVRAGTFVVDDVRLLNLLGLALRRLRRNAEAHETYERALAIAPDHFDILLSASANAVTLGESDDARRYAERAVQLRPGSAVALRVLADAESASGRSAEAAALYEQAIALDPASADLHANLSDALVALGRTEEALAAGRRALELDPGSVAAHMCIGRALQKLGDTPEARRHFRAASDAAPEMAEAHTAYLFCLAHDGSMTPEQVYAEHVRIGDLIEAPYRQSWPQHENARDPERQLRIGFVSGDLRDHAVAYFLEPIWKALHGGRNRIVAYAHLHAEDAVSAHLRELTDEWVRIERLNDEALCDRICADHIDILIDLAGYTKNNRLTAFARKPAPIQVSWVGYPGTTGLSAIDYRLVSRLSTEGTGLDALFREKLVRLGYRLYRPEPSAPDVGPLPALANGRLTFGSFGRPIKIGDAVLVLWSRVLAAVPQSRLLVAAAGEERVQERLRNAFAAHGIASERLDFRPPLSVVDYLALHNEVDIMLDSFPYGGGTTANHALWMGVPVLTLAGRTLQQNQASGILRLLEMKDWVAATEDAYVEQARWAAEHLTALSDLRLGLRQRMASVLQSAGDDAARELDAVFRTMWRRWCAGEPAQSFSVTA